MASSQGLVYTPVDQIQGIYDEVKATFNTHRTRNVLWRKAQLQALGHMIQDNEVRFTHALKTDLGRSAFETITAETNALKAEINEALAHVAKWAKPQYVKTT